MIVMTNLQMARALSGATRECPEYCKHGERCGNFHSALNACLSCSPTCKCCHGTGRVPILNPERARKACPYNGMVYTPGRGLTMQAITQYQAAHNRGKCPCHGDGWLSTLLGESEQCPVLLQEMAHYGVRSHAANCSGGCKGTLIVQAWRLQLLIDVLEEAGYEVTLVAGWKVWRFGTVAPAGGAPSLAVAACEALNLKTPEKV